MSGPTKDCTEAIIEYARHVHHEVTNRRIKIDVHDDEKWQRGLDGVARRETVQRPHVWLLASDGSERYEAACEAVRNDPNFGPIVGGMIGSALGRSRFDEATVISAAVHAFLPAADQSPVDEDAARRKIAVFRDYVTATVRHTAVLIPFPGLKSALFPFEIEDGLQIDTFTDDEIHACATTGVLQPAFYGMPMLSAEECVGVRIRLTTPAVTTAPGDMPGELASDPPPASPHKFGDRSQLYFTDVVEDVLFVLRLARAESISARGAVHVNDSLMGTSYMSSTRATRRQVHTSYEIDHGTGERIREMWRLMRATTSPQSLPSICLRRFNAAMDRASLEDSAIDHLIAAEALFLSDIRNAEGRGELGFRLALRAGAFLEGNGRSRRSTFKFMKKAYDLRSRVAHGESAPAEILVPERGKVRMSQFIGELAQLMREALTLALQEYASLQDFATSTYWDELLLGSPDEAASPSD